MSNFEDQLKAFLDDTSDNLKEKYENWISNLEYITITKTSDVEYKSREWFDIRRDAFSIRKKAAAKLIPLWIHKYGSLHNCPVEYQDTLNIPFKQIKEPK